MIDISIPLNPPMPIWPNSKGFKLSWTKRLDLGDACNNSIIECDTHVGTHLDAPLHFIEEGLSVEKFQLDILIGPCLVVYLPKVTEIHANDLSTQKAHRPVPSLESKLPKIFFNTSIRKNFYD